ncbi:MAG TPA: IS630 family transposase [Longimicrobium sp.]|nr:IS630 family transposase [Longimicrobium sp.]
MRLFVQDEARFGLHEGSTRRFITAPGVKPHQLVLPRYEYFWLFGAAEPATGESFFLEMPALDSACFQVFIDEFARANRESMNVLVVDGAPAHIAHSLVIPDNVVLFRLPPYCPELNPIERVWQDLRKRLLIGLPAGLKALRDDVTRIVCEYTPEILSTITGYPYLRRVCAQLN